MALTATIILCFSILLTLVQPQNIERSHHGTLQEMIDYTKQFKENREAEPELTEETGEKSSLQNDHLLRELFKEFVVQYQQFTEGQNSEKITSTTTTTTTTDVPYNADPLTFPNNHPSPVQRPKSAVTIGSPKRRISSRRKANSPKATPFDYATTTPATVFSTPGKLRNREVTTSFSTLLQKYVGLGSQTTKKPKAQILSSISQMLKANAVVTNQPQKFIPKSKTAHNPPRLDTKMLDPVSPKSKVEKDTKSEFDEKEFRRQAESAKYEFASEVDDEISGSLQQREEVRDGLSVKGKYSYKDGFYKRTVHYEADDKGYRVVKEEVEPLHGPQSNPDGHAKVSSYVAGNVVNYEITKDDITKKNQKVIFNEVENVEDYEEEV